MKYLYYVKDNFKNEAHIDKIAVCREDNEYLYCDQMVLEKKQIYLVNENNHGLCRCYGYDMDLVDLQLMKYRLHQLEVNPSWRNSAEVEVLKNKIAERLSVYEGILSRG